MDTQKLLARFSVNHAYAELICVMLLSVVARIIPHPPNVAPIAAMALYSGAKIGEGRATLLPILAMILSDWIIGFHSTMMYVYSAFLFITLLGIASRNHKKWGTIASLSIFSSFLFFLITNFGVWMSGDMYPHTIRGIISAYEMGLPFLRNTLIGDFVYTNLFFYGFQAIGIVAQFPKFTARYTLSRPTDPKTHTVSTGE